MPSWKKVLVSGSNIEVNKITASGVPTVDSEDNILSIDPNTGGITQISQGNVTGASPTFNIAGFIQDTESVDNFDSGTDRLEFRTDNDTHGFGFEMSASANNTSSVSLRVPQDLKTAANVTFNSVKASSHIEHNNDSNTKIAFTDDAISIEAGGVKMITLVESEIIPNIVLINSGGLDVDFIVAGNTDDHLLFADGGNNKVAIGTATVDTNSLLTVDGNIKVAGITASALPVNTTSANVIVDAGSGQLESRDIDALLATATGSISASIVGTANEIEVTSPNEGDVVIGIVDNPTLTGNVQVTGNISASGDITGSNLRIDNDIAIGGNLFSFTGLSLIENLSATLTGSNFFGSGSDPALVSQQLTGSVSITGSGLTIIGGGVTAADNTGSFGYLTALEISSSGRLFASLSNDDSTKGDNVVVHDNATGQFFTTSSDSIGVNDYNDLLNIPADIVSGSTLNSNTQGVVIHTVNGVSSNTTITNLNSTGTPTFGNTTVGNITSTGNSALGNDQADTHKFIGHITASGDISASENLFAQIPDSSNTGFKTVMYDTATGKFHRTGSYGGGGSGGQSSISSNIQGAVTHSHNGIINKQSLGLTPFDDVKFNSAYITGGLVVKGDTVITGSLTVLGSTTEISSTHLIVEDQFILLGSGSADAGANDGGIIVEQDASGTGTALFWDTDKQNWAIDVGGADASSNQATNDVNVATIQKASGGGTAPTSDPLLGNDSTSRKGHFFIDDDDDFGVYVYV